VQAYEQLKQLVADVEEDIRKAEGGNKAAGTRVRKSMQDVKNIAQEIRKQVLELRGSD
jgi:histone H1-like protein Hc1